MNIEELKSFSLHGNYKELNELLKSSTFVLKSNVENALNYLKKLDCKDESLIYLHILLSIKSFHLIHLNVSNFLINFDIKQILCAIPHLEELIKKFITFMSENKILIKAIHPIGVKYSTLFS